LIGSGVRGTKGGDLGRGAGDGNTAQHFLGVQYLG